jgi:hypothetical protein
MHRWPFTSVSLGEAVLVLIGLVLVINLSVLLVSLALWLRDRHDGLRAQRPRVPGTTEDPGPRDHQGPTAPMGST